MRPPRLIFPQEIEDKDLQGLNTFLKGISESFDQIQVTGVVPKEKVCMIDKICADINLEVKYVD